MAREIYPKHSKGQRNQRETAAAAAGLTRSLFDPHILRDLPFWIWDQREHRKHLDEKGELRCCFNHAIGLPIKWDRQKPIFAWQQQIYDALEHHKHIWIKKSTGLGISEFMLRYLAYKVTTFQMPIGSRICLVTGPRIDLAITLISRFKNLFERFRIFEDKETVATCENNTRLEAYPSHHLDSMRGLTDVRFILLDEADFFPPGQQQDARDVSERYIAKSNPHIVLVSTPNAPDGLFEHIEREPQETCLYHRIFLPYTIGMRTIYDDVEIANAMESPSFEREYNLKYLGGIGNLFHINDVMQCIDDTYNPYDPSMIRSTFYGRAMGVDPGFGSSNFGIAITQGRDDKIEVLYAEEFEKPRPEECIDRIIELRQRFRVQSIFIDASAAGFITSLKYRIGDSDYDSYESRLEKVPDNIINSLADPGIYGRHYAVKPVNFGTMHRALLAHDLQIISKHHIRIHPSFVKLFVALRTAFLKPSGVLDKEQTSYDDLFDAWSLSNLNYFWKERDYNTA